MSNAFELVRKERKAQCRNCIEDAYYANPLCIACRLQDKQGDVLNGYGVPDYGDDEEDEDENDNGDIWGLWYCRKGAHR